MSFEAPKATPPKSTPPTPEEKAGVELLHKRDKELNSGKGVSHAVEQHKRIQGLKETALPPSQPLERIHIYLERWKRLLYTKNPKQRARNLDTLKRLFHEKHIIKEEDVPESYFELQRRIACERGQAFPQTISTRMRHEAYEILQKDQEASLDYWLDYLSSDAAKSAYPMWAKYWALRSVLGLGDYDKEKHEFKKRSKDTTGPFPDLNQEALTKVVDFIIATQSGSKIENPIPEPNNPYAKETKAVSDEDFEKLLTTKQFAKYYAFAIEHVVASTEELWEETRGEWRVFKEGSDASELTKTLQGKGTGWCTAGTYTATEQLSQGDFYVYYSLNKFGEPTIPRLAIRMEGEEIAEVRGVAHKQEVDPYMTETIESKMGEFGDKGEVYKEKMKDMERMRDISDRHVKGESLAVEDLRFLYEVDKEIGSFGGGRDERIEEILSKRNWKEDMCTVFGLSSEMSLSEIANHMIDAGAVQSVIKRPRLVSSFDESVLLKIIDAGEADYVKRRITLIPSKYHNTIALRLVALDETLSRFKDDFENLHKDLAKALIEAGQEELVAENYSKFDGLDEEIADLLIEKGSGQVVLKGPYHFRIAEYSTLPERFVTAGFMWQLAPYLGKFNDLDTSIGAELARFHQTSLEVVTNLASFKSEAYAGIADILIETKQGGLLAEHIEKFVGINHRDIANRLIVAGQGDVIAKNLDNFKDIDHEEIANLLMANSAGKSLIHHIKKFKGMDHTKVARLLIKANDGSEVIKDATDGLNRLEVDHNFIAQELIDAGEGKLLLDNYRKFNGLSPEILNWIEENKKK